MIEDMQLRNLGAETQRAYVHYISGLARFYQTSPEQLGLEEIREYQLYLINERRYSPESVNAFVSAAKFLYNVTLETPWPEGALPRCRVPRKLPVVLSAPEMHEFFQQVCTLRYRAALMTAYGAGLRVSEVVALQVGDIDSKRMLIRVRQGKGKKDRTIYLEQQSLDALKKYLAEREDVPYYDHFFLAKNGTSLNVRSIRYMIEKYMKKAGIKKRATVHTLRHTFGTHKVANGMDLPNLQKIMGHRKLETTYRYVHLAKTNLRQQQEQTAL